MTWEGFDDERVVSLGLPFVVVHAGTDGAMFAELDAAYQRITIEDPEVNLGVHLPSDLSTLQGTYSGSANLFGVSMQYRF